MNNINSALPTPSSAYHRGPIRLTNSLWRGLNRVGLAKTELQLDRLLAEARKETGLSDFGDERFMTPLKLLIEGLEQEADLNPLGRVLQRMNIQRILKHRLLAEELFKQHPEILEREIRSPIVVVGPARAGTTRLHRLIAADQRFLHLKSWESVNPVPYKESFAARDRNEPEQDPRIKSIDQGLKAVLYMAPQMAAVHPLETHAVEEEIGLLQHSFSTQLFEVQANLPSFAEWLMNNDQGYAYEYMVKLMKLISWFRNDPQDKPWVLKSPQHLQDLDALLAVFPDARLVCPHRDPVKVIGSVCSLTWNSIVRDSDNLLPDSIGPGWLDKTERMLHKCLAIRHQYPAERQYDVLYADISSDWRGAMEGIYDFLGMKLDAPAITNMEAWLNRNAQHKHGAHRYQLSDFGLDADHVDKRLMFYRERFGIPYERKNPHQ